MEITLDTTEQIMELSLGKFKWKTAGDIDKVAELFDDELVCVQECGHSLSKAELILELKSKLLVYNRIEPQKIDVKMYGDVAVLTGRAWFTINGGKFYKAAYTEVYIKKCDQWKLINLQSTWYD
jgi:hypothetical protein